MENFGLSFFFSLVLAGVAHEQNTITFDDLNGATANQMSLVAVNNGYQGLNWSNVYLVNTSGLTPSSFVNGTVSGPNVAIGAFVTESPFTHQIYGGPTSINASIPFLLVSGYFTSAHQNQMNLEITGLNGTSTVFDQIFILNVDGPSLLTFPALPVTEVDFATSGGVYAPEAGFVGGTEMILDNLTIAPVPEPSAGWLVGAGLSAMALLQRKRD